ncbi:GntR family transcriptional regulator [Salinifilum ghardaiensis]
MNRSRRTIEPLERESTPSIIADKLRTAIGRGHFSAGEQLGEAQLARELGVSRGSLREGMQRLTQEGLLVSIRNRGLFVVDMTPENVHDMYVARAAVERAAAEQIFRHDPREAGDQLLGITEQMAQAAERADDGGVTEADIEFHQRLVDLARSPRLDRIHMTLLTETRMCIHALEETYSHSDERVAEHRGIAEAFRDANPTLCDARLVAHMEDAVERLTGAAASRPDA